MALIKASNAGQLCISPSRFYVQEGIYDSLVSALLSELDKQKVGNGLDDGAIMCPLCDERRLSAAEEMGEDAREK